MGVPTQSDSGICGSVVSSSSGIGTENFPKMDLKSSNIEIWPLMPALNRFLEK